MSNFLYDSYIILNKVYGEKSYLKQAINSTVMEEKNKPLTVKIVYGVVENELLFNHYIKQLTKSAPKLVIRTILKQSMYLIKFSKKPVYTVTNEAVDLAKKLGKGGVGGFINAFLRNFSKNEPSLPNGELERLSLTYSYPMFALKTLIADYSKDAAIKIISYNNTDKTLRFVNGSENYIEKFSLKLSPFKNVFFAEKLSLDDGFYNGDYTVQSIGSVAICEIVKPCTDFLDCCAAPGGKSVNLSVKCKNITAFDIYEHRLELITQYAERMKVSNITCKLQDMTVYNENYKDSFDGALCDVPCSGFGVVADNPDIKINRSNADIDSLVKTQRAIIENAGRYVKAGGYLYYSTCSIFKEENDGIVSEFLKNNKNYIAVDISSPLKHIKTAHGLQFLPHISEGAGFYISKLKRIN